MARSIFFFRHVSTPHVRGAFGARGPPIERPEHSSFRTMAEASAVISYQPTQDAFAASVPTARVGVRSPLARLPLRRIGADRGFAGSEAPTSGVAEAPPSICSPSLRCPTPSSPLVIPEGWPPSTSSEPVQALVTRRPSQPGAFHHRHAPDRSRARAMHRERCRNTFVTQWTGDP
jgi:hypothetical protein